MKNYCSTKANLYLSTATAGVIVLCVAFDIQAQTLNINVKPDADSKEISTQPRVWIDSVITLDQAIQQAIEHNHDMRLARISVDGAEASSRIASASVNPTLTIQTAGINPRLGVGSGNLKDKTIDSTFRIDQLIERGNKRELRMETAAHLEQASKFEKNGAELQIKKAVSFAYYDLLAAQYKFHVSGENRDSFKTTLIAAEKRKKLGDIAGADVARVKVDALRAANEVNQAAGDLLRAQLNLKNLIGTQPSGDTLKAADVWPDRAIFPTLTSVENFIQQRPDVQAAKARLDVAFSNRKLAIAGKTRDVSVGMQYEHYPVSPANQLGSGNSYGISIQIPLFVRYEFQGEIRNAEVAVNNAQEILNKSIDAARVELLMAMHGVETSKELLDRFESELLPASKQSAEAAEFAFKNGAIPVMDVLDARRVLRAIELDAISARAEFAKNYQLFKMSFEGQDKK